MVNVINDSRSPTGVSNAMEKPVQERTEVRNARYQELVRQRLGQEIEALEECKRKIAEEVLREIP